MKLQLHRSIIFWSGILVMGFMAWAWRDSTHRHPLVTWGKYWAMGYEGGVDLWHNPTQNRELRFDALPGAPGPSPEMFPGIFFGHGIGQEADAAWDREYQQQPSFRAKKQWGLRLSTPEVWLLCIPYWLILVVVAGAWFPLLWWRARRRKKRMTNEVCGKEMNGA